MKMSSNRQKQKGKDSYESTLRLDLELDNLAHWMKQLNAPSDCESARKPIVPSKPDSSSRLIRSRAAAQQPPPSSSSASSTASRSYKPRRFLSRPVLHELNKFFFDVTANPSREQVRQLWDELNEITMGPLGDSVTKDDIIGCGKIIKWFQNKRAYMKLVQKEEAARAIARAITRRIKLFQAAAHYESDALHESSSDPEAASESGDSSDESD
ncbi:MAG: hypothetical protein P4L81_03420 [Candidatus Pacebacteria bacterium]|nr:hypothetical protein [Candidatus Paceibacterota bacterium]